MALHFKVISSKQMVRFLRRIYCSGQWKQKKNCVQSEELLAGKRGVEAVLRMRWCPKRRQCLRIKPVSPWLPWTWGVDPNFRMTCTSSSTLARWAPLVCL